MGVKTEKLWTSLVVHSLKLWALRFHCKRCRFESWLRKFPIHMVQPEKKKQKIPEKFLEDNIEVYIYNLRVRKDLLNRTQ